MSRIEETLYKDEREPNPHQETPVLGEPPEIVTPPGPEREPDSQQENFDSLSYLKRSRAGHKGVVTKKINELDTLRLDPENLDLVREKQLELKDTFERFTNAHMKIQPHTAEDIDYYNHEEAVYNEANHRASLWIMTVEMQNAVLPGDSISQVPSRTSKHSRRSSYYLQAEADEKALEAKIKMMSVERELKEKRMKIEAEQKERLIALETEEKLLQANIELAQVRARKAAYPSTITSRKSNKTSSKTHNTGKTLNPHAPTWVPVRDSYQGVISSPVNDVNVDMLTIQAKQTECLERIVHQQEQSCMSLMLPTPVVVPFNGDPIQYHAFVSAFDSLIESRTTNEQLRLQYLVQFTEGDVQKLMSSCMDMPSDKGYKEARRLLRSTYGQSYKIATAQKAP